MTRYRIIDTMHKDNEQHLSEDVDRAVDDERVYLLEVDDDE
jgi:hypothetical protein